MRLIALVYKRKFSIFDFLSFHFQYYFWKAKLYLQNYSAWTPLLHTSAERWRKQQNTTFIQFHFELLSFKRFMCHKKNYYERNSTKETDDVVSFRILNNFPWEGHLLFGVHCIAHPHKHTLTLRAQHLIVFPFINFKWFLSFPPSHVQCNVQPDERWIIGTTNVFVVSLRLPNNFQNNELINSKFGFGAQREWELVVNWRYNVNSDAESINDWITWYINLNNLNLKLC